MLTLFLFLLSTPAFAAGFEIHNSFTQEISYSTKKAGQTAGASGLIMRNLGPSTHPRVSFVLMKKKDRELKLLTGAYIRLPMLFAFTGYGSDIRGPRGFEWGAEFGVSWFDFVRTIFCYAPSWSVTYTTSDILGSTGSELAQFTAKHQTYGLRLEIPILIFDADPDDRRLDFGALLAYRADKITELSLQPINFSSAGSTAIGTTTGSQQVGYSFLYGVFFNVRI